MLMLRAAAVIVFCILATTWAQCPPQLPADSTCTGTTWIVNQAFFTLSDNLDISVATLNVTGSYLQLPNATLIVEWDGTMNGQIFIGDSALLSGNLVVRFTSRPQKSMRRQVLAAGSVTGDFQSVSATRNYTGICDGLSLTLDRPAYASGIAAEFFAVSRGDRCRKPSHTALIVVCVLSGVAVLAVIAYLVFTECSQKIRNYLQE